MAVWKQLPYYFFEVDAVEAWLDEQVSKGLSLQKIRGSFCRFEHASSGMTRYRVNVLSEDSQAKKEERIAAYREMGWEFVTPMSGKAEIYRALTPDAVELNTDEEVLNDALHASIKGQLIGSVLLAAINLFNIIRFLLSVRRTGLYTTFLQDGIWAPISLAVAILAIAFAVFSYIQPAIAVRKRSLLTRSYHSPAVFSHRRRRSRILIVFASAMLVCMFMMERDYKTYTIDPADCHPLLTLEDFLPEIHDYIIEDNYCSVSSTEKTVNYQQRGATYVPNDGQTYLDMYSFYYDISTRTIRWQWLADGYAREYTKDWEQIEVSGYDGAWYHTYDRLLASEEYSNYQHIVLLQDNEVIEIRYMVSGPTYAADLHDVIPLLAR